MIVSITDDNGHEIAVVVGYTNEVAEMTSEAIEDAIESGSTELHILVSH